MLQATVCFQNIQKEKISVVYLQNDTASHISQLHELISDLSPVFQSFGVSPFWPFMIQQISMGRSTPFICLSIQAFGVFKSLTVYFLVVSIIWFSLSENVCQFLPLYFVDDFPTIQCWSRTSSWKYIEASFLTWKQKTPIRNIMESLTLRKPVSEVFIISPTMKHVNISFLQSMKMTKCRSPN